jgi:hypothetical protein
MSNFLQELGEYIDDEGLATLGTDLFLGQLPPKAPNNSLWIVPSVSPRPRIDFKVFDQFIDIWGRNRSPQAGYAKMEALVDALHQKENWTLDNYHIYISNLQSTIADLGNDANNRKMFQAQFRFLYRAKE